MDTKNILLIVGVMVLVLALGFVMNTSMTGKTITAIPDFTVFEDLTYSKIVGGQSYEISIIKITSEEITLSANSEIVAIPIHEVKILNNNLRVQVKKLAEKRIGRNYAILSLAVEEKPVTAFDDGITYQEVLNMLKDCEVKTNSNSQIVSEICGTQTCIFGQDSEKNIIDCNSQATETTKTMCCSN